MMYFYRALMIFMLTSGCGGIAEDVVQETNQSDVSTSALGGVCNTDTALVACGAGTWTCLVICAPTVPTGIAGAVLCGSLCGGVLVPCALEVQACWDLLTNPQSGGTGGTNPGTATGCQDFDTTLPAITDGWTNTGITVTGATLVEVDVSGPVVYASGATQGPDGPGIPGGGWIDCAMSDSRTCQSGCGSFPFRAVMGKFGPGYPFVVGSHFEGASTSAGNLYLTLNDCAFSDNSGAFSVHVTVCR